MWLAGALHWKQVSFNINSNLQVRLRRYQQIYAMIFGELKK